MVFCVLARHLAELRVWQQTREQNKTESKQVRDVLAQYALNSDL